MRFKIKKTCSHKYLIYDSSAIGATIEGLMVFTDNLRCKKCGKEKNAGKYVMREGYDNIMHPLFFSHGGPWPVDPETGKQLEIVV